MHGGCYHGARCRARPVHVLVKVEVRVRVRVRVGVRAPGGLGVRVGSCLGELAAKRAAFSYSPAW